MLKRLLRVIVHGQHSLGVFGVLMHATNRLLVSGVILSSPSNPGTPQNACILRGAPFGLSSPVIEMGDRPLTREYCLAPSCGFPQKPFPPEGPHGFRGHLRRSGMRASEDGASTAPPCYAACNAPAKRSDGALPTHCRPALGTHTVAAALKRAPPCERLVSGSTPNEITSGLRTSRSWVSLFRPRMRDGVFGDALSNLFEARGRYFDEHTYSKPDGGIRMRCAKKPLYWGPAKRRSVGSPPKKFPVGSKRARFAGKRSNRAQAKGKPLFQAAFLQFSANCDAGAYFLVRDRIAERGFDKAGRQQPNFEVRGRYFDEEQGKALPHKRRVLMRT